MTTERRFVFDTNVLIRALLIRQSVARQAFDLALKQGQLLMSLATLEELHQVLLWNWRLRETLPVSSATTKTCWHYTRFAGYPY